MTTALGVYHATTVRTMRIMKERRQNNFNKSVYWKNYK
jgi:hypothetical protein